MNDPLEIFNIVTSELTEITKNVLKAESGELTKREDRAPYPPDGPVEILPPIDEKEAARKRKALDNEFWESQS